MRKSSEERRKEIVEVTIRLIDEEGLKAVTLRRISESIGISEAALFRHFRSREDIISAVLDGATSKRLKPEGEPLEALERVLRARFAMFSRDPGRAAVLFNPEVFREYPSLDERFQAHRRANRDMIRDLVRAGQGSGQIAPWVDPSTFSTVFMGTIRMAVLEWTAGDIDDIDVIVDSMVEHLLAPLRCFHEH